MEGAASVEPLYREAALWLVGERDLEPVIRAACDLLAAGADGADLAALAGISVHASELAANADEVIHAALAEQGRPLPVRESEGAAEVALRAMAQEAVDGRWVPRELAAWAHRVIGHEGPDLAQPLVLLDDNYDIGFKRSEQLDDEVLAFCRDLVARG